MIANFADASKASVKLSTDDEYIEIVDNESQKIAAHNQKKDFEKFLASFKITFDDGNGKNPALNRTMSTRAKPIQKSEKDLQLMARQVFGGKSYRKKRIDRKGKEIKYYKDYSVPILFRKVIPPGGAPLPKLKFAFEEDGKSCRCSCKV